MHRYIGKNALKTKNKIFDSKEKVILFFIFLGAINFLNRYYYCLFIAFIILLFVKNKNAVLEKSLSVGCLIVLSACMILFSESFSISPTFILKPFVYPICYILGYNLMITKKKDKITKMSMLTILVLVVAVGNFSHIILNLLTNLDSVYWNTIDFWTHEELSATSQNALACLPIAISCSVLFSKSDIKKKIVSCVTLLVVLYYNLILAGRTVIMMIIIMLTICFVWSMLENGPDKRKIKVLFGILLGIVLLILLYEYNVFHIKETVEKSNLYYRFLGYQNAQGVTEDTRLIYKGLYMDKLFLSPFGGGNIRKSVGEYAHDIFLDTYDEAGIFAFLAIAIYIVCSIVNLTAVCKNKIWSRNFKMTIFCVYIIMYIKFAMEPILQGIPWFFAFFCFIDGAISKLKHASKGKMIQQKSEV